MDKNKIMLIVIIVLLVLLLGAIAFIGWKAAGLMGGGEQVEDPFIKEVVELKPQDFLYVNLDAPISTNLRTGADGKEHVARISLTFGLDNRDPENEEYVLFLETFNNSMLMIRSICLDVIASKTYEEVVAPDAREVIAEEILSALQDTFQSNYINSVFVTDTWWD